MPLPDRLADPVAEEDPPPADLFADLLREALVADDLAAEDCFAAALVSCVENRSVAELALAPDLELCEPDLLDD